jgi:hypothetical protein
MLMGICVCINIYKRKEIPQGEELHKLDAMVTEDSIVKIGDIESATASKVEE